MGRKSYDIKEGQMFGRWEVMYKVPCKNGHSYWHCKCACDKHTEKDVRGTCLIKGQSTSCGCKKIEELIVDLTGKKIFKLTPIKYDKDKHKWECKCDCGNTTYVSTANLTGGDITKSCGCWNIENLHSRRENLIGQTFGNLNVLDYNTITCKWICQCNCKNQTIKEVSTSHLKSGSVTSCGCLVSKGENKIINLLSENNIDFIAQKTFDTCRFLDTNRLAKFDFYINNQYLVEYDGQQHFYSSTGWNNEEKFEKTQQHDAIKNQWCKENNIPLIRIPYTHLNNLCLEDLIPERSDFLIC